MVDYPDAQIPCLVIEYLRKTEEFRNFACMGPRLTVLSKNMFVENLVTLFL